ncbi:hypothetical protein NDU88_010633 [Pleurodeles waltl]|uniref:Uncharacterized protein n=1 Tax=Pleurodeles waltl TaxID=8319 RepID=A0AAV7PYH2_PLEWA|nr:hypothetical protein NDU88_010633 [Pleurodeles waltl]
MLLFYDLESMKVHRATGRPCKGLRRAPEAHRHTRSGGDLHRLSDVQIISVSRSLWKAPFASDWQTEGELCKVAAVVMLAGWLQALLAGCPAFLFNSPRAGYSAAS